MRIMHRLLAQAQAYIGRFVHFPNRKQTYGKGRQKTKPKERLFHHPPAVSPPNRIKLHIEHGGYQLHVSTLAVEIRQFEMFFVNVCRKQIVEMFFQIGVKTFRIGVFAFRFAVHDDQMHVFRTSETAKIIYLEAYPIRLGGCGRANDDQMLRSPEILFQNLFQFFRNDVRRSEKQLLHRFGRQSFFFNQRCRQTPPPESAMQRLCLRFIVRIVTYKCEVIVSVRRFDFLFLIHIIYIWCFIFPKPVYNILSFALRK